MPAAATSPPALTASPAGGWRLAGWASLRVIAAVTDRHTDRATLLAGHAGAGYVEAEQVHGASTAMVDGRAAAAMVAGCDALATASPGVALLIRTADCLPLFFADPRRGVVALAHAGWRGLVAGLPARVLAVLRHAYHCAPEDVTVAIGPSIRACCYDVGPEFSRTFGAFVREARGRRTCDLTGAAIAQLTRCGVRAERILDTGCCTACETARWYSLRREGPSTGRLTSMIMLRA